MPTLRTAKAIDRGRRAFLGTAAIGIVAAGAASLLGPDRGIASTSDEVRPFRIHVPEEALIELRQRIETTRWPDHETVRDRSQGVRLANLQELVRYWGAEYDWRKAEAKLNALPQFTTEIDGLDIHFIHVRSRHAKALR